MWRGNRGELGSQVGPRHDEFNRGELWQEDWLKCYFWWRTPPGDLYSNQWYCETVLPFVKVIIIIRVCKRMSIEMCEQARLYTANLD